MTTKTTTKPAPMPAMMTKEEIKALLKKKGWTQRALADRWELTERRIGQMISDPNRPGYYDDALRGLPYANGVE
ncbi:hypothetical protein CF123_17755 [Aeromonas veronii]|uniref:HTH cro/C1-type domain-containing protein n=1 Tax=Aeromonas veronii TaxID=654 RepID=A0AAX2UQ83_AERVE|nr:MULTISPECIES: helix-turn-helix transcriptional regulator [Aeromonas]TND51963.1 hypothetical protein CF123_17755 [Aeromonas veronii]